MAELKAGERLRAIKEVMYALVVQRFIDAGAPLLKKVPFVAVDPVMLMSAAAATNLGLVASVEVKEKELTQVRGGG